ncbi:MAG: hypothetical protein ACKVUS_09310 [Saprospiraceae bacterium]
MKNKLVTWSTNAENEKVLLAFELQADSSTVKIYTFPESIADEEFAQKIMREWRDGKGDVALPEGYETIERELSVTESILPEHLKVERPELVQRTQAEWHFDVLSAKLYAAYQQELAEFKEKVEAMSDYDGKVFISLRTFWDKVQGQSRDRNLFRQHADYLRDGINALFEQLKEIRTRVDAEASEVSKGAFDGFAKTLDEIEARIAAGGAKFNSVFDELKKVQREYQTTRMTNEHRNKLWDRLDAAFKKAKERKFGSEVNAGTIAERHNRRLAGLEDVVKRLEESIRRDDEDLAFQRKKVNTSEGQLEAQIRSARIKMIEERVSGKREKLVEITKARNDVQRQANSAYEREARFAAKEAERKQIEAKRAAIRSEIEAETKAKAKAAAAHVPPAVKEDSLFESAKNVLGDVFMDAVDTARAVAIVASDKVEEAFSQAMDRAEDALESLKKDETLDNAKAMASVAAEKAQAAFSQAMDKAEDALESFKKSETLDKAKAMASVAAEKAQAAFNQVMDKAEDALESFKKDDAPTSAEASHDHIIIDDVVHKNEDGADALESFAAAEEAVASPESASHEHIIIDDVVHKNEGEADALESFAAAEEAAATPESASDDHIIIDDVVHKNEGEADALESFAAAEEAAAPDDSSAEAPTEVEAKEPAAKPKRTAKKNEDA